MKSLFTVITLCTASLLVADPYQQPDYRQSGHSYQQGSDCGEVYYGEDFHPGHNGQRNQNRSYYQDGHYNQNGQYYQQDGQNYNSNGQDRYQQNYNNNNNNSQDRYQQNYANNGQGSGLVQRPVVNNNNAPANNSNGNQEVHVYKNDSQYQNSDKTNNNSNKPASDQDVVKSVHDAIGSGWFSKGYENIAFSVNNGVVTLRGTVDSVENKNKVEDTVKKINGVKQVSNQITVAAPDQQRSTTPAKRYSQDYAATDQDRILNGKIRDKLSSGWFVRGNDNVSVKTTNGVVTISGVVDSYDEIQKVNDQLKDVDGIKTLNNQLSVRKQ